jgi:hypothetical protein
MRKRKLKGGRREKRISGGEKGKAIPVTGREGP